MQALAMSAGLALEVGYGKNQSLQLLLCRDTSHAGCEVAARLSPVKQTAAYQIQVFAI